MSITTTTHLNFGGDARAALEFYRTVFGGHLTIATYGDLGMPREAPVPTPWSSARSRPETASG